MRPNRLRQRLDAGQPTLGTHILACWPTLVELVGQAGNYDYIEFDGEYAPFTMHDLDNLGRAFELMDLAGMVKVEQTQYAHQAMRAIGSGFQSILFADVRTVEDARESVAAVRAETVPLRRGKGLLGVGLRRDVGSMREPGSVGYVNALNDVIVAIMVEKRECVENLDAILSVPGIDMVQFGPADYAMSIGHAGDWGHPDVRAAERFAIETALKKGIHPRVEIREPAQAEPYIEMGVKHFCMGWDVGILHEYWQKNGEAMAALLTGKVAVAEPTKVETAKVETAAGNYR
jgi:4-hydroxy-2-oxoheptanedioate aldolase